MPQNSFPATPTDELLAFVRERQGEFVKFLGDLVTAESPSDEPHSHREIRELLIDALADIGYRTTIVRGNGESPHLYAQPRQRPRSGTAQLILGHFDTVWPLGTLREMPFGVNENVVTGPGVYDMKGGLAQAIFALRALQALDIAPSLAPCFFLNSDEEIGSRGSRRYISRLAPQMQRVFVLEPSLGPAGAIKTTRKGVGRFTIVVKGRAAHAGLDPTAGASAILEMSHVIQTLFALNDADRGVTVNVGTVDGGLRPNVVAPESSAAVDVRVLAQEDAERVERAILGMSPVTPGVTLHIEGRIGRPPMEHTDRNRRLWELARLAGRDLGLELEQGAAGGGSDGNFTSLHTGTLDGLGAVGDGAHARHEFLYLDKSLERAALLAMLLAAPPQPGEDDR